MNEKTIGYGIAGLVLATAIIFAVTGKAVPITSGPGIWVASFLTLAIFSFLYDDNPLYKFAEHLFVGVSAAYWMVIGIWQTLMPNLIGRLFPEWVADTFDIKAEIAANYFYIVPLLLGILLLCKLIPGIHWLSRWALAFIIGTTAGLNFVRYLMSNFIAQIRNSMIPLVVIEDGAFSLGRSFSNIVMVTGIMAALFYFFFSKEHKGWFGTASKYGVIILMIAFGAAFGYTVMGRIALLIGRIEFLLHSWLQII